MWVPNLYSLRWSRNRAIFWSILGKASRDDSMKMRLSKSSGDDIMTMFMSKSPDVDSMAMCLLVCRINDTVTVHDEDCVRRRATSVANNKLRNFRPPLKERGWVWVSTHIWANFHTIFKSFSILDDFSVQTCPSVSTHLYSPAFLKWEIAQFIVRY